MITYPIFTFKKEPYRIFYTTDQIKVKKVKGSHTETLDDKTYGGDYFTRLVQMEHRVRFDFTCGTTLFALFTILLFIGDMIVSVIFVFLLAKDLSR